LNDEGIVEFDPNGAPRATGAPNNILRHVSRIFRALFEPNMAELDQYFSTSITGERAHWELKLEPRAGLRAAFKGISVRGSKFVEEVNIAEANGDKTTIRFHATTEAPSLDEGDKRFFAHQ
jgi:hypothetical protein